MAAKSNPGAGYFRVPLQTARALATETQNPDALAAWLTMRRFAYGHNRELTCAGAKKVAASLGHASRRRAGRLLENLLAVRYGLRGESAALVTAADWNGTTGHKLPAMKGNAPVYVMPDPGGPRAYLPDLLIPPGEVRSRLADLCDLDESAAMDALLLLLRAYEATCCADFIGADPDSFAYRKWRLTGEALTSDGEWTLGYIGNDRDRHYWLATEADADSTAWSAIEGLTGCRTEGGAERFWKALATLGELGLLYRVAIVSDGRGRLLYPLWVYGESHRRRLGDLGIAGDLARAFHRGASRAGLEHAGDLAFSATLETTDLFIAATRTATAPTIRTVWAPTLIAPTPENMAGMAEVAKLCRSWA